jgi:Tol biopolymer transport system component
MKADGSEPVALTSDPPLDWAPLWSPDGRYIYFSSDRGGTMNLWRLVVDEASGQPRGEPQPVGVPAAWTGASSLSRDGKVLAYASAEWRSTVRTISWDDGRGPLVGRPTPVFARSGSMTWMGWSPDSSWLAINDWGRHEEIFLIHPDGSGYRQLVDDGFRNRHPQVSPDGSQISFYSDRGGGYRVWSIRPDGSGLQALTPAEREMTQSAWAPDGRRLATSNLTATIMIADLAKPLAERIVETLPPLEDVRVAPLDMEWSPDGGTISFATTGLDGTNRLFGYSFATRSYRKLAERARWAAWLSDGRRLVYSKDAQLVLLDTVSGASRDLLPDGMVSKDAVVFGAPSHDGKTLAFVERTLDGDIWAMTLP